MDYYSLQNGSDIRGTALEGVKGEEVNLTEEAVYNIARAFHSWLKDHEKKDKLKITVGHDSRLTGEALQEAVMNGLVFDGTEVLDCDLASTPSMFMSCIFDEFDADGAIMITASHLPFNKNGLKFFTKGGGLDSKDIKEILKRADKEEFSHSTNGSITKANLMEIYSRHLIHLIKEGVNSEDNYDRPLEDLHVVVDAGNGAGGFYVDKVLEPLGAKTEGSQFLEPDGHFPNHIPNPENKEAMESIQKAVLSNDADLGIIFDTDVDRSAAVDENGKPINRNAIVALASVLAAEDHEDTTVVTDSVTSEELNGFLERRGIKHLRFRRGYKNVINKAVQLNRDGIDCQLAIETSGHAAFKENHFLDDGAYLATKIIIQAAKSSISELIGDLKEAMESGEYRLKITADEFKTEGERIIEGLFKKADEKNIRIADENYEGIRLYFDDKDENGWAQVRMSLHEPLLPINIEANTKGGKDKIALKLKDLLQDFEVDTSQLEK